VAGVDVVFGVEAGVVGVFGVEAELLLAFGIMMGFTGVTGFEAITGILSEVVAGIEGFVPGPFFLAYGPLYFSSSVTQEVCSLTVLAEKVLEQSIHVYEAFRHI